MCWVYILQNPAGKFYVGHTDDLQTRLHSHNRTDAIRGKFTRKNGPLGIGLERGASDASRRHEPGAPN
jgi:predicted GIY-YIG superfamily endonuclease